jgi:signal transduction histidine kinase
MGLWVYFTFRYTGRGRRVTTLVAVSILAMVGLSVLTAVLGELAWPNHSVELTNLVTGTSAVLVQALTIVSVFALVDETIQGNQYLFRAFAESLDDPTVDQQGVAERIERTVREIASIGDTVDSADRLMRSDGADRQRVDVSDLARLVLARQLRSDPDVTADVSGSAGPIYTDPQTLETVLSELVENAVKHNDQPDRRVSVEITGSDRGVELAVRDNGPGIPRNERTVLLDGERLIPAPPSSAAETQQATACRAILTGDVPRPRPFFCIARLHH